jgi:hypothetical protein
VAVPHTHCRFPPQAAALFLAQLLAALPERSAVVVEDATAGDPRAAAITWCVRLWHGMLITACALQLVNHGFLTMPCSMLQMACFNHTYASMKLSCLVSA